jgi:hypothetical protein
MIIPCNSASTKPKSNVQVKPAPAREVGCEANTFTVELPQSIKPSGPTANTCNDSFPSASDMTMRSMPFVSGFELIQTPRSAVSVNAPFNPLSIRSLS